MGWNRYPRTFFTEVANLVAQIIDKKLTTDGETAYVWARKLIEEKYHGLSLELE